MADLPRSTTPSLEAEFRQVTVDRQADDFMRSARNAQQFRENRLFVPSVEELNYRAGIRPPTTGTPRPEFLPYQPTTSYRPTSQTSTPYRPTSVDRLPRPSGGSPPPTPRSSGGGARTVMIEPPPTAAPRSSTTMANPRPGARPSSIPIPAGRFSPPVAGVAADIGFRIFVGQPPAQVVVGGAGNLAGTVVGSLLGGPVGGMVGGFAGGQLADLIYKQFAPKKADIPVSPKTGPAPFTGGQSTGVTYRVTISWIIQDQGQYFPSGDVVFVAGKILGCTIINNGQRVDINCADSGDSSAVTNHFIYEVTGGASLHNAKIIKISRADGQPDIGGNPTPLPIPKDTRNPDSLGHPGNQTFVPPSATPAAGKSPAPTNYVPGGDRSRTGGTPRGDSPTWVAPAALAGSPHPVHMPQPLVAPMPVTMPAPGSKSATKPSEGDRAYPAASPNPIGSPAATPTSTPAPSPNAGNFSSPQAAGGPAILKFPSAAPVTTNVSPTPDALQPIPRPTTAPGTGTPPTKPKEEDLNDDIKDLGLKLAALTLLIKGLEKPVETIIQNTSAPALEATVCRPTQPGGCSSNLVKNAVGKGNEDLKDFIKKSGLDAAAQAEQLRLLNQLDEKLGSQIPGGISGFLQKFAKSIHLDKLINALTLIATLHNAAMLSRNLGSTLGDVTSQALSVIGIKDEEGSPIDINKQISQEVNKLFENVLGAETWKGVKTSWNKANTIISSASNIIYTVRSLWDSSKEILEWTAENTGRIGNALKRFRVVGENAYRYMPEQVTHTNAWSLKMNRFREGTDSLDDTASSLSGVLGGVQSIQEETKELKQQKDTFDKNLKDLTPKTREDNKPVADTVAAGKMASVAPVDAANVFRGEGETDA